MTASPQHDALMARPKGSGAAATWTAERGAASLAVVMVLFLVMALVAGYTGRNLIFEQRTGVNQWRSTQAIEVAQAGLDWTIAQLNSGRILPDCTASASTDDTTFRQRYLLIDPETGVIRRRLTGSGNPLWPTCVANDDGWTCNCPITNNLVAAPPAGEQVRPAFRVQFVVEPTGAPGVIGVKINGCTRSEEDCLKFALPLVPDGRSTAGDARATITALLALKSGLAVPPSVAALVRTSASGDVQLVNEDVASGGFTVQAGGAVTIPAGKLYSTAGTPSLRTILDADPTLADAALPADPFAIGDRMFAQSFALWPSLYRDQPGTVVVNCGGGTCTDAQVRTAISLNPGRPIWVAGALEVSTPTDLSGPPPPPPDADPRALPVNPPSVPAVLVVEGNLTFSTPSSPPVRIQGTVYGGRSSVAPGPPWSLSGPGEIVGAVVAEHALNGVGDPTVRYSIEVVSFLRLQTGTFAMVPGSWKDFR